MKKVVASILALVIVVGTIWIATSKLDKLKEKYDKDNDPTRVPEEKLSDILPTLTIPKLYDTRIENNVESLFYNLDAITVSTMSNAMKLTLVVNQLYDKEYKDLDETIKLKGSIVKEYYHKLYGNIEYIPETFTYFESKNCPRIYEYNTIEDTYTITLPDCGGRVGPAIWKEYIIKDKEAKDGNKVYIDYYVASYTEVLESEQEEQIEQGIEPVQIFDKIFDKKIYMGKEISSSIMNDLIKKNLISKYRLTYEKGQDGKYYFTTGSWIQNTLS